ncbi:MAG: hypothetical protein C5B49_02660 [Bdellovibrio sp.]|nr:MAG: hypothetical protein C5B49_02660 [Bdellovibrio sp.]
MDPCRVNIVGSPRRKPINYLSVIFFAVTAIVNSQADAVAPARKVELVQDYRPKVQAGTLDLFIPLPFENANYQKLLSEKYESNATWVKEEVVPLNKSGDSVRLFHAHWVQIDKPSLRLWQVISISDRDSGVPAKSADPSFLRTTEHIQTDGEVKETAEKITKGLSDPDEKAKAIYDWLVDNSLPDLRSSTCGEVDLKTMLPTDSKATATRSSEKCADPNALFVGLARAAGIPAREVWGLRITPSTRPKSLKKAEDAAKAQHGRAEYYSKIKKAWFPVDPVDVRAIIRDEELSPQDARLKELRPRFFGAWEGNWVAYNYGRDFQLATGKKVNYLMSPLLFSGEFPPTSMDSAESGYSFSAKVLPERY